MTEEKYVVTARVSAEVAARLDRLAEQAQRSKSDVIRLLIENATAADLIPASLKETTAEPSTEAAQ